jgi:hypothetical protein
MFSLQIIATPPYPLGMLFGKTGLYLSTPFLTKLMFHDYSLINNSQDTCTSQTIREVKTLHIITPELAVQVFHYITNREAQVM